MKPTMLLQLLLYVSRYHTKVTSVRRTTTGRLLAPATTASIHPSTPSTPPSVLYST